MRITNHPNSQNKSPISPFKCQIGPSILISRISYIFFVEWDASNQTERIPFNRTVQIRNHILLYVSISQIVLIFIIYFFITTMNKSFKIFQSFWKKYLQLLFLSSFNRYQPSKHFLILFFPYNVIIVMDSSATMIISTREIINNYAMTVSLTKQMQIEVNKVFNELQILAMIYAEASQQLKNIINKEILTVQKRVMEATKQSSGFFGRFVGSWQPGKSAVSLENVWTKLAEVEEIGSYQHLILEMKQLKNQS